MLNKIQLIGRVGADPESRFMPNGNRVVTLSLATTRKWKNKDGQKQEDTEWYRCTFFSGLADVVAEYVSKGGLIYVGGRGKTNKWTGQDGKDNYSFGVVADEMYMLGKKGDDANKSGFYEAKKDEPPANAPPIEHDNYDDDIPF